MATIKISQNKFEDAVIITSEDGQVIEAVVIHLPGSGETSFALGTYNGHDENIQDSYQVLASFPVQAA
jgi:hypothetical protein